MQVLIDDKQFQADLMALRLYAIANIVDVSEGNLKDLRPVGDNPNHVVTSGTMVIVYSIENQPSGVYHHLSVSKKRENLPNPAIVDYLVKTMKIAEGLRIGTQIWQEDIAINVIAPYLTRYSINHYR